MNTGKFMTHNESDSLIPEKESMTVEFKKA